MHEQVAIATVAVHFTISRICDPNIVIASCLVGQINGNNPPARATMRDVRATVTERGAGCDGRCDVRRVFLPDETSAAYGEVVWSWRRDPGVYPARLCGHGNGDNKGRSPGRVRISRQTIARGRPGCLGCTCQSRVRSLLPIAHGTAGAASARLSLRPLRLRGTTNCNHSGEIAPRERERLPRSSLRRSLITVPWLE
jgi:hypothetical protein